MKRSVAICVALSAFFTFVGGSRNSNAGEPDQNNSQVPASQIVQDGPARFEVLSPNLIRMEYAGDQQFQDQPTFNAIGRDTFPQASYTTAVSGGVRIISTKYFTLKYVENTGPFSAQNVTLTLQNSGRIISAAPWSTAVMPFNTLFEAENAVLSGDATVATNHPGYTGGGFVIGFENVGAQLSFGLTGVPAAGTYALQIRYANAHANRTQSLFVDGVAVGQINFSGTGSWNTWNIATMPVKLSAGSHTFAIVCDSSDVGDNVNFDSLIVAAQGAPFPSASAPVAATTPSAHVALGGYRRGLDDVVGIASTSPGLLYQDGWTLLDDTTSALFDPTTGIAGQRPTHGSQPYQDGYIFAYGQNYQQALNDFRNLAGPPLMPPRWALGVWFSRYYAYHASDYENTILPAFRHDNVPLDVLVTDTDWKSPSSWYGWEFNSTYFPDPAGYLEWAHSQGLHTSFNIHPSIGSKDTKFTEAQQTAQNDLAQDKSNDNSRGSFVFDWGIPSQLTAYFDLHQDLEQDGVDLWWLDWCCDNSQSSLAGVTPDAWINYNYAKDMGKNGGRGFAFSRAFSSLNASTHPGSVALPTGPWADHRYTVHFTGDARSEWPVLQFEVAYTAAESAATGLPYVSHDIGGLTVAHLGDDLYVRWVQFGTFQPILRLHSNHGDRLPWNYTADAKAAAEYFLQLRERLVPYSYTLAKEAFDTGLPIVQATYLQYPGQANAYANADSEYFYGPSLLVAPVTTAGTSAATSVWIPPGIWTNYFTGRSYTGPSKQSVVTDWNAMPVFIKAGGIVPQRTDNVANDVQNPLDQVTLIVGAGGDGSFNLYEDEGESDFPTTDAATTKIVYSEQSGARTLSIGAPSGTFTGQAATRTWTADFVGVAAPSSVSADGSTIGPSNSGMGWSYNATTATLEVRLGSSDVLAPHTIAVR